MKIMTFMLIYLITLGSCTARNDSNETNVPTTQALGITPPIVLPRAIRGASNPHTQVIPGLTPQSHQNYPRGRHLPKVQAQEEDGFLESDRPTSRRRIQNSSPSNVTPGAVREF